jgi:Pregnancy-associated plasma protein-A
MAKKKSASKKPDKKVTAKSAPTETHRGRMCGTMQQHFYLLETVPSFRTNQIQLEGACKVAQRTTRALRTEPYVINVVVHVVHNPSVPSEKISAAQVKSQIAVLNRDFRAKNPDKSKVPTVFSGLVADSMIEFKLATKDPSGNATTGITYTETSETSFSDRNDPVKSAASGGADAWNPKKYLNMWVATLEGGLLGYAQFPGGPEATDGVVILNTAFGTTGTAAAPFNLGRTATHEIGHYLNLRHIWGDDGDCSLSDLVADTPNCETANTGKPVFPKVSCGNGPNGDMFMNYMDYTDDDTMYMFTPGQVSRMVTTLEGPRKTLVT